MCTLIAMWRMFEDTPLLIAANRDERIARPAASPSLHRQDGRRFVAPTDLSAGGTWLGFNDTATFVGITNRFGALKPDAQRSRGLLVLDALATGSATDIDGAFTDLDVSLYAGFHLFFADRFHAGVLWSDGAVLHRLVLAPGLSVITERSFDAAPTTREATIRHRIGTPPEAPDDPWLVALLSARSEIGFEGVNVSVPELGYGTRSSTILRLTGDGGARFLHANGPPDQARFEDLAPLLEALFE